MDYNFDEIVPRRGTRSYKWDSAADAGVLPMWVADMDFRTLPAIVGALQRRVAHGIFGYTKVPDAYYEAIVNWFSARHGWTMNRPARLDDEPRMDYLYHRGGPCRIGYHQGDDPAGRSGDCADSGV